MVDGEGLVFEKHEHENREDGQRKEFLNHLELPKVERTTVLEKTDAVRRNHKTVFNERNAPTE